MLKFSEGYLYFAYSVLGFSIFMPLTKNITWKKSYQIIPVLLLFIFFPLSFSNSGFDGVYYYKSLYIDPILGLIFGYSCFLSMSNAFSNKEKSIMFFLSLIVLVLLKDTGLILSCIVYMLFFLNELFVFKNNNYKFKFINFKNYLKIISPLLIILLTFCSWKITKEINYAPASFADSVNVKKVVQSFISPNSNQNEIKQDLIYALQKTPIVYTKYENLNNYLNCKNFTILFSIIILIMIIFEKNNQRKAYLFVLISILIGLLIYSLAMLVFFIFATNIVVCFQRYFCTYFMGMFTLVFLIIMDKTLQNIIRFKILGIILLILGLFIFQVEFPNKYQLIDLKEYDKISLNYSNKIAKLINNCGEQTKLIICSTSRINGPPSYLLTLYHHHISLDLMEFNIKTSWETPSIDENFDISILFPNEKNKNFETPSNIEYKIDYLFIIIENEDDAKKVSQSLGIKIVKSTLFKLETINGENHLEVIE